mmetsp:Transcript_39718/g.98396  ORF Transcript_39718/g.98396 Transcript_39718/m.98396 type:complete len:200 (+) Transcript_39718:416-1015(+)
MARRRRRRSDGRSYRRSLWRRRASGRSDRAPLGRRGAVAAAWLTRPLAAVRRAAAVEERGMERGELPAEGLLRLRLRPRGAHHLERLGEAHAVSLNEVADNDRGRPRLPLVAVHEHPPVRAHARALEEGDGFREVIEERLGVHVPQRQPEVLKAVLLLEEIGDAAVGARRRDVDDVPHVQLAEERPVLRDSLVSHVQPR